MRRSAWSSTLGRAKDRPALTRLPILVALLIGIVTGCASPSAAPPASSSPSGLPQQPLEATPLPLATPTLDVVTPERVGRSFLEAWAQGDYGLMYGLLTPDLRNELTAEAFAQTYSSALDATTTITVTVLPQTLNIDNDRAWIDFREVWVTGVFGELQANNRLNMVRIGDQWWVAWDRGTIWPDLANGTRFVVEYQIPARANIYDYKGAGLAVPGTIVTVGVIPGQIQDEVLVLDTLSKVLDMTYADIQARYAGQPADWFIAIGDITGDESLAYDQALTLPGIERRERTARLYPLDGVGAHAVGWVSQIPAETYTAYRQRGYRGDEYVGISGLEAWGESILAGRNGVKLYLVSAEGTYLGGLAERAPERGRAIHATLDRDLQAQAEQALGDMRGAVVALDVHTGAIRALASGPGFDNNIFVRPSDDWRRQAVIYDANQPLLNRAVFGQYPAGSAFKIVTISAALGPGGMTADTTFNCTGVWDALGIASRKACWLTTGHNDITLQDGLTGSCNVVFYNVGVQLDGIDPTILPTYARAFGLGEKTGLEALPESSGLVPDPEWKLATYQENWTVGDTVNMSIGQGYLLVTPLQLARMIAAVANGGTLYQPYLVDRVVGSGDILDKVTAPLVVGHLPVSEAHLTIIKDALLGVTTNPTIGTATHRFSGLDILVAGKTGTAEPGPAGAMSHSWFIGYFPADNPQFAMAVLAENAGEGSTVAAPLFRQIVEGYYGLPITPLPQLTPAP